MQRFLRKPGIWILAIALAGLFAVVWSISPEWSRSGNKMVVLSGNTPAALNQAQFLGRSNPTDTIQVIVGLNIQNESDLDDLLKRQADPTSPDFRKWLTPDQFTRLYAPDQKDVDDIVDYLKQNGITVLKVTDNRLLIHIEGTVDQLEQAFKVRINKYQLNSQVHFSNDRDPSVPAHLAPHVRSVIGMNTFAVLQGKHRKLQNAAAPRAGTPTGHSPKDVATAYDLPNENNKNAVTNKYSGKGVTIAVATAYTYDQADVDAFWNQFGIKRTGTITNIPVNGTATELNGETTLDLQQVGAQAPGADILMYLGIDPSFTTFSLVFNQIVTDNKADVVSISWGLCENSTGSAQMYSEHVIFKQGNAQGISFFAAAGDDGAYDCSPKKGTPLGVDYPSSDPHVTAVGGTALTLNADGSRRTETVWTGGGGGISQEYDLPHWQHGPGVATGEKRNTSDVALVADPWTGYSMYFEGNWEQSGGTSFGSPNWAALWALASEAHGSRLGIANETLYRIGRSTDYSTVFHDITSGNNGDGRGPGYNAVSTWDHPTGWGVPIGSKLVDWLAKDKATPASAPEQN